MEDTVVHPNEFVNSKVHCSVHRKPKCIVEFLVKASASFIQQMKDKALKELSKQVNIPGFRKGKAPSSILLSKYPEKIKKHSQDLLVSAVYKECQSLVSIPNIDAKEKFSYKIQSYTDEAASLLLSFETAPLIPTVDIFAYIPTPTIQPEIGEEKVAEAIRQALFFYATWQPITDRPSQEGDFVILDVDVIDQTVKPFSVFQGTRFEVGSPTMAVWMKEAILGKHCNESVEATSVPDEDASEEEKLIFKPRKVRITIRNIEKAILPELDSALLQKMGASSEEDLKQKVSNQLHKQADAFVDSEMQKKVWAYLLQTYSFDIPETFITRELSFRTQNLAQTEGFIDEWNSLSEEEKRNLMKLLFSRSEQSVRLSLLCSKILKEVNIALPKVADPMQYAEQILSQAAHYILEQVEQKSTTPAL